MNRKPAFLHGLNRLFTFGSALCFNLIACLTGRFEKDIPSRSGRTLRLCFEVVCPLHFLRRSVPVPLGSPKTIETLSKNQ